jgi:alpha-glucan phosphorylase-like protein
MGANLNQNRHNSPQWKGMIVQTSFPKGLERLNELANNLWWTWNYEVKDLFEQVDSELWAETLNPIQVLKEISYDRLQELSKDKAFMDFFATVLKKYDAYMGEKSEGKARIAYFSMEYGLDDTLKIFSGGLGILAGDYLKEASDTNTNMVACGFLYKYGYFAQKFSLDGDQIATYNPQNPSELPVELITDSNNNPVTVQVGLPGRIIDAQIWLVMVGRIKLYLLDTDISENSEEDRAISHALYGGDNEHRLKQEMILGIGGIRALEAVGEVPDTFHCNEGHAAFINLERLRKKIKHQGFSFQKALEIVRSSTLYTTHTPVPAGHDSFPEDLMMTYLGQFPERLQLSWNEFMNLGRMYPDNQGEHFSMSNLAIATSQEVNGVSELHGEVSKDMFVDLWPGYNSEESNIGFVTNGIHYGTWTSKEWQILHKETFGEDFLTDQSNHDKWNKIYDVADEKIWDIKQAHRAQLIDYVKTRLHDTWTERFEDPKKLMKINRSVNKETLTIGFARRFATYKRAYLLFSNLERLSKIVNNPDQPVQFLFAGKAHPNDVPGQGIIKEIIRISKLPEFTGKIIFMENYDMNLAKQLVKGVDIWLNTPTRPLEASGTSGMKAVMNGAMNFSVLDGWWCEGYQEGAGWALPEERTYEDQELQNRLDAETIYGIFRKRYCSFILHKR